MPKYLISTRTGFIPNICTENVSDSLSKDFILFIDDFIYKDSIFYHKKINLRDLCNISRTKKIFLLFKSDKKKNKERVLINKRGYLGINKEEYLRFVDILEPDYYQDYDTKIFCTSNNGDKIKICDPKTLEDFQKINLDDIDFVGTSFLNDLVDKNEMLDIVDNKIEIKGVKKRN
ncbi:hypothetical protein P3W45_000152 [Vairimorpha bombi]